jgi:hypothetical protein
MEVRDLGFLYGSFRSVLSQVAVFYLECWNFASFSWVGRQAGYLEVLPASGS